MTKRSDERLKEDIESELRWDPKLTASTIGVTVEKGAVSLLGAVDSYAHKWAAEDATRRVVGVRTVAQDLTVKIHGDHRRSDSEIAVAVQHALKWDVFTPSTVTARVAESAVTLEGEVRWNFEREAAVLAVSNLTGVVAVHDYIALKGPAETAKVKESVEAALQRQASSDGRSITVAAAAGVVTLAGHATSLQSIADATHAAWAAQGVTQVLDRVELRP
jgi:osmotically-inducible protein OsmY